MLHKVERRGDQAEFSVPVDAQRWGGTIGLAIAVGVAYFIAARLGLALLTDPEDVAVFWPASGLAAGTLIAIRHVERVPVAVAVMVASIAASLLGDRSVWSALVFALCNTGEALFVAWLIERWFGPAFSLDSLRRVLGLFAAAGIASATAAVPAAVAMRVFGPSAAPFFDVWEDWFTSDAVGIITVAPLVIGLVAAVREPPPRGELIEGVAALVALAAASAPGFAFATMTIVSLALVLPLLLWPAARCRPVFAAAAVSIVAITIVLTMTFGFGRLGDAKIPLDERAYAAQAALLAITFCALVLAALFAERRRSEARLQEALAAGQIVAFEWDPRTRCSQHSANATQILGFAAQESLTAARFLAHIHPDDRAGFKAQLYGVRPDNSTYTARFRFIRPDGGEVWLKETARAEFDAGGRFVRLKGLTRDITRRKRAEEHQNALIAELDHRVRNVLARVAVVAKDTCRTTCQSCGATNDFIELLDERLQSLADAHKLATKSEWTGGGLAELVRHQLAPYANGGNTQLSGPDVVLTAAATEVVTMVLHELVTNAAKHGALSAPNGRVSVGWRRGPGGSLRIGWRETGGPPVPSEPRSGQGTSLVRELIPYELGGAIDLVFAPSGVCCTIELPGEELEIAASDNPLR